ncbi:MAG: SDR family NAD(P)-dependent oxidoreductase [Pseudomonadales bacterium]
MSEKLSFAGQVVLVTGSSRGLGNAFADCLATAGATVIINDSQPSERGQAACDAITAAGGQAVYLPGDVTDGAALMEATLAACGRIDAIVHNAGIVQDKTLRKMSDQQWQQVLDVHLGAAFKLARAAWPNFENQGSGRLVFISSASGLYGNFGQSNYAAAKAGMYGLCRTIALEGEQLNINCNCVAPFGATEMNSGHMSAEMKAIIKTDYVAPLVAYLCHPSCSESGSLFEASAGTYKKVRWERNAGLQLDTRQGVSVDDIAANWSQLTAFDETEHPNEMREALRGLWDR